MASMCKQDSDSDLNKDVIVMPLSGLTGKEQFNPECEVTYEGGKSLEELNADCTKNPGHPNFLPLSQLKLEHLPAEHRLQEVMDVIHTRCDLTVRIVVKYTSRNRPDTFMDCNIPYPYREHRGSKRATRYGTGRIYREQSVVNKPCPCFICIESHRPHMKYWTFTIDTATHVIFDDSEAAQAVFDCFYDDVNGFQEANRLYGCSLISTDRRRLRLRRGHTKCEKEQHYQLDQCTVLCVTHNSNLGTKLSAILDRREYIEEKIFQTVPPSFGMLISHPHGTSKKITFGDVVHITVPIYDRYPVNQPIAFEERTRCRLPLFPWSSCDQKDKSLCYSDSNTNSSSRSPSYSFITEYDSSLLPGTNFRLPKGMTFTLPPNAEYVFRFTSFRPDSYTFPPGTRFTLPTDQEVFFPPEAEFFSLGHCMTLGYMTYNIDTCPGSSGASLIHYVNPGIQNKLDQDVYHSGSLLNRLNRSGLEMLDFLTII